MPLVSAVIPTYNRGYVLRDAIESALTQTAPDVDVEVIVADDGSTDDTAALAGEYGDRIVYLFQPNTGAAAARNLGVMAARGDYIAFLDSDDVWLPGKLKAETALFEQSPEAGVIASDAEAWSEDRLVQASWLTGRGMSITSPAPFLLPVDSTMWLNGSMFATSSITIRRSCLRTLGDAPFDLELRRMEDWLLEIRLFRYCRILVLPALLTRIRRYRDGTREGGRLPGGERSSEQVRNDTRIELRVLEKALSLDWPDAIDREAREAYERRAARLG